MDIIEEYIYRFHLDINSEELVSACNQISKAILFNTSMIDFYEDTPITTRFHRTYNFFNFKEKFKVIDLLFNSIKESFLAVRRIDEIYYIKSWLNIYTPGTQIGWHTHGEYNTDYWHGFFIVNPAGGKTEYNLTKSKKTILLENQLNMLYLVETKEDLHRGIPGNMDVPKITIAFDIVPEYLIKDILPNMEYIKLT